MKKEMPTSGVLGVYTGRALGDADGGNGMKQIHEVMDHFYPGIMTLGIAHMAKTASKEVLRQVPAVADLAQPEDWAAGYSEYLKQGIAKFGETIMLDGPHGTGNPDMHEANNSPGGI